MLRVVWVNMATLFLQMRECILTRRRRIESSEEVVADFHTYLEQMNQKCGELEGKIQKCNQRALMHKQKANAEGTRNGKQRELARAKMYLQVEALCVCLWMQQSHSL
jgi:hypothetical protein